MNRIGLTHTGPIVGAGSRGGVYDSSVGVPNMGEALRGWGRPLTIGLIRKELKDRREVDTNIVKIETQGTIQPFTAEQLKTKPEGERSWKWQMLHCTPSVEMETDDVAIIKGVRYRVMGKLPYGDYGYVQYELCQDYQNARV